MHLQNLRGDNHVFGAKHKGTNTRTEQYRRARSSSTTRSSVTCIALPFFFLRFLPLCAQHAPWSRRHCILFVNDVLTFAVTRAVAFRSCCGVCCPFCRCRFSSADTDPLRCSATVSWHCSGGRPTSYLTLPPVMFLRSKFSLLLADALLLREVRNPNSSCSTRHLPRHSAVIQVPHTSRFV